MAKIIEDTFDIDFTDTQQERGVYKGFYSVTFELNGNWFKTGLSVEKEGNPVEIQKELQDAVHSFIQNEGEIPIKEISDYIYKQKTRGK